MPIAYSYARFSSEKQAKGDSLRRQRDLAVQYLQRHPELGLELDNSLKLTDEGLSAYKGTAQKSGTLGAFMRLIEDDKIEPGSYLLVESLDRLSRQTPREALNQMSSIVDKGIVLVTLMDNKVYTKEILDKDSGMSLIFAIMLMSRAHEESQTKSRRVKAAWANKFDKLADGKQLTRRVPFWINPGDKNKLLEDKVPIIKQIFKMSADGIGAHSIAKQLNTDGIPSPTGRAKFWSTGTIKKILKNPNVVGIFTTADGAEHKGYFPRVVSDSVYRKVQTYSRTSKTARGADNRSKHPLAGVVWCARCGSTAHFVTKHGRLKQDGTKTQWQYLVCSQSVSSNEGCEYKAIQNWMVVRGVVSALEEYKYVDSSDVYLTEKRKLEERLRSLEAILDFGIIDTTTPLAKQRYTDALKQAGSITLKIKELDENRRPLNRKLFERTQQEVLDGEVVTNAQIRMLILRCEIDFDNRCVKVTFMNNDEKIVWL